VGEIGQPLAPPGEADFGEQRLPDGGHDPLLLAVKREDGGKRVAEVGRGPEGGEMVLPVGGRKAALSRFFRGRALGTGGQWPLLSLVQRKIS
jgi:hypothetical protein